MNWEEAVKLYVSNSELLKDTELQGFFPLDNSLNR